MIALHTLLSSIAVLTSSVSGPVSCCKAKKKKTSLFPVAGLKIAMRNAFFFFFFFTIHEKAMRNAVFIFLNKTSGRKYIKTIALVSFQHLLRILPVSYKNDLCDHSFYMHSVHL